MEPMVHVSRDGKVIGSYPLSAMRTMIDRGLVRRSDFYHMRGMSDWLLVENGNFSAFEPLPDYPGRAPRPNLQAPRATAAQPARAGLPLAAWLTVAVAVAVALSAFGYLVYSGSIGSDHPEHFATDIRKPSPGEYLAIRRQAAAGDVDAYVRLGLCELWGIGTQESPAAAVASFRHAAEKGHPVGQFWLGVAYLDGNGISKDQRTGFELIRKAAEQGLPYAGYRLGMLYYNGIGTSKSLPESLRWVRRAADDGLPDAQGAYGIALRTGEGVAENPTEAIRYFKLAAESGIEFAQYNLAEMYIEGEGVDENPREALRYLRMSEKEGYHPAIYLLARCYLGEVKGLVARDLTGGVEYLRKAADKGSVEALVKLGQQYFRGEGVAKSESAAFDHYLKAAKRGHAGAQAVVGMLYRDGVGTEKSPRLAFRYFYESGMRENPLGAYHLALCYAKGHGVDVKPDHAAHFFRIACAGGVSEAFAEYAKINFNGVGLVQDKTLAYAYGLVALAKGVESAKVWADINPADPTAASINQEKGKALAKQILAALEAGRPIPTISDERDDEESAAGVSSGSGMIFTGEGHCFTNHHVVAGASRFFVVAAGSNRRLAAELVVVDAANDLAILKVREWAAPPGAPSLPPPVIDSKSANAGDRVFTFGYPVPDILSDAVKYTSGDINALSGMRGDQNQMQVSMPIHSGNSGGPVALEDGRVVGVVVSTANAEFFYKASQNIPQNINFAIKADYLRILAQNNGIRLPSSSVSGDPKQHVRAYTVQVIAEK